jgi:sugar lactone lactonase YvrE
MPAIPPRKSITAKFMASMLYFWGRFAPPALRLPLPRRAHRRCFKASHLKQRKEFEMNVPRFACLLALACAGGCVSSYASLTEPVGTSSATQTATVTITTAGTLQTISVLTQGAIGLDFNAASGGTCTAGTTYAVGNTCTVNYTFKPTRPWIRYGGITLFDSSGNLLGNIYLTGTGTGPQPIFPSNASATPLGSGFSSPQGLAVDGRGNLFVTDDSNSAVKEMVAVNGRIPADPTIRNLGSVFINPYGLAVDGSGNVYVADVYKGIYEIVAVNGSIPANPTIRALGSGSDASECVAVDGTGNVYFCDATNNGSIKEMAAVNGIIPPNPTIRTLTSGFDFNGFGAASLAVDGTGNVYFADWVRSKVKEIVAVNGSIPVNPTVRTWVNDFLEPYGVAVDGSGNVYVAEYGNSQVRKIVAVNGIIPDHPTILTLGSGFSYPWGIAVDGSGNVFVTDYNDSLVAELNLADPPNLSFAATLVGSTSSDSPQSVTVENNGNAALTGALSVTANWDQVAGSGTPGDCIASFSLVPGAECNLSISFAPIEADNPLTGAATFTDNALNAAGATQEISLSGIGIGVPKLSVSTTALAFGNLALGQQEEMSLQVTNTGSAPVTFAPVINGPSFTVPPSENGCGTVIPIGHSCSISVRFLPRTYGGHVDTLTLAGPQVTAPTVQLTGQTLGVGAELGLLVFGTIPYGTTATLSVPIVNYGVAGKVTFSTSINGPGFKVLTAGNTCPSGVTAAQQCTIPVEFSPSTVGDYAELLTITATSGDVSVVKLNGIGSYPNRYVAPTEPIGKSSGMQTATLPITVAGTLQTISVLTQGAIGLDFNLASGGTCSVGTAYSVGQACTVNYTFKPTRPWNRYGGITLVDGSGNLLGNTYLTGTGTGPQPVFPSKNHAHTLGTYNTPKGIAVDGNGNVFVGDTGDNEMSEILAVDGKIPSNPNIIYSLGSQLSYPSTVAVDGSGNVYTNDGGRIQELVAVNGSMPVNPAIRFLGSGSYNPAALAVDGSGNVFVAGNGQVLEMVTVNGSVPPNPTMKTLGSGFITPSGVAVDASGNVFVADQGTDTVEEIVAVNGAIPDNPIIKTLSGGFNYPTCVVLDGSGNLYVADAGNGVIKELVAVSGSIPDNPTIKIIGTGFYDPFGVAVDGSGNVFVADTGHYLVAEVDLADPPSLSFAATLVGSTSSPQPVTLENNGNATLTGSSLSVSANWNQVAGSGTPVDCTSSFSLVAGAECNLSITFKPTESGKPLTGDATLTDNALNVAGSTQEVLLSGEAVANASHIATINRH